MGKTALLEGNKVIGREVFVEMRCECRMMGSKSPNAGLVSRKRVEIASDPGIMVDLKAHYRPLKKGAGDRMCHWRF